MTNFLDTEENKRLNIELAEKIYKFIKSEPTIRNMDEDERHKLVREKYTSFSNTFPTVVRFLAKDLMYSSKTFRWYLDKLEQIQGQGMMPLLELQCKYGRNLYIQTQRDQRKHVDFTKADLIYKGLHNNMVKYYEETRKKEEEGKSEYEEKNKKYTEEKRKHLLNFIRSTPMIEQVEVTEREKQELIDLIEEENWSAARLVFSKEGAEELVAELKKYENDLLFFLERKNHDLEYLQTIEEEKALDQLLAKKSEFLQDTNLAPRKKMSRREARRQKK